MYKKTQILGTTIFEGLLHATSMIKGDYLAERHGQ